tara:strand:+ start:628 stop:960 length:333 start_codon:yes stop_codon:yes gene_type:complete
MNTQKSVYNRLFSKVEKTELESQKVELAIIDDIVSSAKKVFDQRDKVVQAMRLVSKEAKEGLIFANKSLKDIEEFERKAKDLGIDLPKKVVSAKTQMTERKKDFENWLNR